MQKSIFLPAFLAGIAAPVSLHAGPRNYLAYIPGPAESFFAANGFIAVVLAGHIQAINKIAQVQNQTPAAKEPNARPAAVRSFDSAA
jgi:hypothetical protein